MLNPSLSHSARLNAAACHGARWAVSVTLAVWLGLVVLLGARGAFVAPLGAPPVALVLGVAIPLVVFFAAYRLSDSFRDLVLTADLRFIAGIQAWRVLGFAFLALYAYGILPGMFAWPAGLGDMAVGITAPWIIAALIRRPDFAASKTFRAWNLFGILDLVVALGTGGLTAVLATGAPGEITAAPMTELPLLLVPGYLVPLLLMLHATALLQARRLSGR
jgi:hypothetical protein